MTRKMDFHVSWAMKNENYDFTISAEMTFGNSRRFILPQCGVLRLMGEVSSITRENMKSLFLSFVCGQMFFLPWRSQNQPCSGDFRLGGGVLSYVYVAYLIQKQTKNRHTGYI